MSYTAKCNQCECPIWMEDDFDPADDHRCEECRSSENHEYAVECEVLDSLRFYK